MPQPFEVVNSTVGKSRKRERDVIGVMCPTALAQFMGLADPIFVSMGNVTVDWDAEVTDGYRAMFEWPSSNDTGNGPRQAQLAEGPR